MPRNTEQLLRNLFETDFVTFKKKKIQLRVRHALQIKKRLAFLFLLPS